MDFFDAVRKRRSVRKYLPETIPPEDIHKILEAGLLAPNSSNMQPWEFYWVRSPEKKQALAKACFDQNAASTAAELIVAVSRTDTWKRNRQWMLEVVKKQQAKPMVVQYYEKLIPMVYAQGPLGIFGLIKRIAAFFIGWFRPIPRYPHSPSQLRNLVTKTTALACENIMLAATALGYGSCPMEGFDEVLVKKLLGLGCHTQVVMVISIGKTDPSGIYGEQIRFDKKHFVFEV